jgi:hypothetical protein
MPVDIHSPVPVWIPCENGSTTAQEGLLHGLHTPYDYNEVFLND